MEQLILLISKRVIEQLTLEEAIFKVSTSSSNLSKWRTLLGTIFNVAFFNVGNQTDLISMFIEKLTSAEELEKDKILEKAHLISNYMSLEKRLLKLNQENHDQINILNGNICSLKDELNLHIEISSMKLVRSRCYEEKLAKEFHDMERLNTKEWNEKIDLLDKKMRDECNRSSAVENKLCSEIEEFQIQLNELRKKWDLSVSEMNEEKQSLLEQSQWIRPKADEHLLILKERKSIVDEERLAKKEAEDKERSYANCLRAAIKIQAHWRGFIARKDYARYKQITQMKVKTKAKKNVMRK